MSQITQDKKLESFNKRKEFIIDLSHVFIGSLFLALISIFKIPLHPTPMTLQTYGVFLLPLLLGPKKGALAVLMYLLEASSGWPILSGGNSNPLWFLSPNAGFLIGFLPAVYLIGYIKEKIKVSRLYKTILVVLLAQMIVYICGVFELSLFFGLKKAIFYGVMPFLLTMPIKVIATSLTYHAFCSIKKTKE